MLQTLRDKTSGWIAAVILVILTIPVALVGVQDYFTGGNNLAVATVRVPPGWWPSAPAFWPVSLAWDEAEVTQAEFRERLEQERQNQRAEQGERFDARAFDSLDNKRRIVEALVDERVQALWAERNGVVVGDAAVRSAITEVPAFQADGKFSLERYRIALATMQPPRSEQQFEQLVRTDLQSRAVSRAVGTSNFATQAEVDRMVGLLYERRDIALVELPAPALVDPASIPDAELQAWYRRNPNDFRAPETIAVEYVELDAAKLPAPVVTEGALRERYERDRARFATQSQRRASHILIEVAKGAPAAAVQAARARAEGLAAQARGGADFAALARANSDDPGSKAAGGDLGWVAPGTMTGPFEDALFKMEPGAISAPVRTDFGWHVIQLREVQAGQQQPFEQVRASLSAELADAERERAYNAQLTKLVDAVLKNPSSLGPAAREAGLPVQRSPAFARGQGPGVLAAPAVQRVAFSESVIQDGMVSDPIEISPNRSVVLRVVAHTPSGTPPFATVRAQVVEAVRADRARKAQEAAVKALVAAAAKGGLEQAAAAQGLPAVRRLQNVPRTGPVVGEGVPEAIFSTAANATASRVLPDGRGVVFTVQRVQPGTLADLPPAQRDGFRRELAQLRGLAEVETLGRALRRSMKVEINEANL